jgi:hypothetical protein
MKRDEPEDDFLDPAGLPDDLKWVAAHHRLHPTDPVYLLLAWHWRRIKQAEDTIQAAILEMRTGLDARLTALSEATDTVEAVNDALVEVQAMLTEKPVELSAQIDAALAKPVQQAVVQVAEVGKSLAHAAKSYRAVRRRETLAALMVGVALGLMAGVILALP